MICRLVAGLFLLVVANVSAFAQGLPAPSYWKNQRGSEMKISAIDVRGNFVGAYINHAAGFQCQNTPYDLRGRAFRGHIVFVVVWTNSVADCKSKTVWRGRVIGPTILTRWVLTGAGFKPLRGTDIFYQQP